MRTQKTGTKDVPPSPNAGQSIGRVRKSEPGSWLWAWVGIGIRKVKAKTCQVESPSWIGAQDFWSGTDLKVGCGGLDKVRRTHGLGWNAGYISPTHA